MMVRTLFIMPRPLPKTTRRSRYWRSASSAPASAHRRAVWAPGAEAGAALRAASAGLGGSSGSEWKQRKVAPRMPPAAAASPRSSGSQPPPGASTTAGASTLPTAIPTQLESAATAVAAAVSRNHAAATRGGVFVNTGCTAAATVWPARRTPYARGPGGSQQASARSAQASRLPQPPPSRHARRPQRCTSAAQTAEAGT